ncbi:MAG: MBL fold metallo-hydrolase [Candidatus Zambryskibacteria bacterium]|nr:MBL fold metallo-hydrolase [Candidatus Zambryskibacteria bacterium]
MFSYKNYTLRYWQEYILIGLLAANIFIWLILYQNKTGLLKVYFLDVGQGEAIFIETPNKRQMLIDGGKNRKVISELGKIMSFGDKAIDVIIATHPDADHIGGLPEVVSRYDVGLIFQSGVESDNTLDNELEKRVKEKNIPEVLARRGMIVNFGDGAKLTVLFPDRDVSNWDTNEASIVAKLEYGNSSFLLTGDSTIKAENILLNLNSELLDSDVLKTGHHGSRTSTSLTYAGAVSPEYAVISAGRDNTYGHPHKEVLNILERVSAKILSTAEIGTIKFETDGEILRLK